METELLKTAVPLLLGWYRVHKRDLPWRENRTPYSALVAELMLQQTRVEAVKERYVAFLNRFPTAEALASASEDEVLKEWEGLGYYSRARNLYAAAKVIAKEGFPRTWYGVRALPGVGDYTAGAVSSIALGLPEPAVDGNVVRVLSRLFADGETDGPALRKRYSAALRAVFPPETGDFTEALMDLGATVCVPNGAPLCEECPWKTLCRAHLANEEGHYPVRAEKKGRRVENLTVYVLKCGEKYALKKRGKGLLAGLWEFPNEPAGPASCRPSMEKLFPFDPATCHSPAEKVPPQGPTSCCPLLGEVPPQGPTSCCPLLGEVPPQGAKGVLAAKTAKHIFTHVEWRMTGYLVETEETDPRFLWATAEEIREKYAIPSAFKAFTEWVK